MLTVLSVCSSWIYLELIEHWYQKVNLIWSSSVAASAPHFHTPWSCPPSSWQQIQIKKKLSMLSLQGFKCHRSFKRHLLCAGGSRNRSARRQRALLSSSQVRQRVLNVCVLTSLNLTFLWRRKQMNGISESRSEVKNKKTNCCVPALLLCASAMFLCSAVQPCRWICIVPQSAPSQNAENEPSVWSSAHQCHSPLLHQEK